MESLFSALMAMLQICLVVLFVAELLTIRRLSPWYVMLRGRETELPPGLPLVADASRLDGLAGERGALRYRWDPERRTLFFGRVYGVIAGERGYPVGALQLDPTGTPSLSWHATPLVLMPAVFGLGLIGLTWLAVVERAPFALLGIPVFAALLALIQWIVRVNARGTLERVLLPKVVEVLRDRLE